MPETLYYVVPCYKDADVLPVTGPAFLLRLVQLTAAGRIGDNSRVLFVDDGSPDGTWNAISELCARDAHAVGIKLAWNAGEKNALLAGMNYAVDCGADCVITADSDLQDDLGVTEEMLQKFEQGSDLVLGVRSERADDRMSERFFSRCFYIAMRLLKTGLVTEHSNFRLMSAAAVKKLNEYADIPYFMPAMASALPLPKSVVTHKRAARAAGRSGYNFIKKIRLALNAMLVHSALLPKLLPAGFCVCQTAAAACAFFFAGSAFSSGVFGWSAGLFQLIALCFAAAALLRRHVFRAHPAGPPYEIERTTEKK